MPAVHDLSKSGIKKLALQKRARGEFYDTRVPHLEDNFRGSVDRFCAIAFAFRECRRVLDAGSGDGLLAALLKMLGHEVFAVDLHDRGQDLVYTRHQIPFQICNLEADDLPFEADSLDAVCCCQVLEHFTHSPLPAVLEIKRVLRSGGVIEIDVPNAASFRNRSRLLRGKHITWDYRQHYLYEKPLVYKGREYYPGRHNRELTRAELYLLLSESGFRDIRTRFLESRRYREGWERLKSIGTVIRDAIPALRKSLLALARK
jgi:SAM-dependent methyltransferase